MKNQHGKLTSTFKFVGWMNICIQCSLPILSSLAMMPARAENSELLLQADEDENQPQQFASMANRAGSFLSNNPDSDAANAMLRNYATGEAGAQAQHWLSQFGTARVQLDVDEHFSLKNSQFDLLVPFYDSPVNVIFSQASVHRTDDRAQSNLGLGYRQFNNNWMLGLNSFVDYDLSRDHARIGFGAEYWRDFLKLGANSYHRLTGWKNSPDLEDYQERPANGWDVRVEGWLPAYAQLGGKLTYEQYYGNEVALFGRDNRQKDPRAITAGITYTPIPLFTLSAEQRQGQSGVHDTRLGLEMNYQLGLSWQQQIDADRVAGMRSLAGSRYDLVARNNNIVLDYRKKDVISLNVVKNLQGISGEQKPLKVQVSSKHGLDRIDWTAAELTAAGGKILSDGASHSVVFPQWKSGAEAVNRYTLHGVAVDSKGNRSPRSETLIEVNSPAISLQNSTLTPIDGALPADGQSQLVMTLNVRDEQQQPIDVDVADVAVAFKAARQVQGATLSAPVRRSAGVFEVVLTSGAQEAPLIIAPTVKGIALAEVTVNVLKDLPDSSESSMDVSDEQNDIAVLSFTAKDAEGNPINGIADKLGLAVKTSSGADAGSVVSFGPITETRAGGKYQTTLKATQADAYVITPLFSGVPMSNLTASVNLTGSAQPDASRSSLIATPDTIVADDVAVTTLTFTANDGSGKPVGAIANRLSLIAYAEDGSEAGQRMTVGKLVESSQRGIYTATLKGQTAGVYTVVPRFDGAALGRLSASITLVDASDIDVEASSFSAAPVFVATHREPSTLSFLAVNDQGSPMSGLADKLEFAVKASNGSAVGSEIVVSAIREQGASGYYSATVHGTKADAYIITPTINGQPVEKLALTVLLYDVPDGAQSTLTGSSSDARSKDDNATSTLTFTARDAQGQLINNITEKLAVRVAANNGSAASVTPFAMRSTDGVYTATFSGSKDDTYTLTMQFEGRDLAGSQPLVLRFDAGVVDVDHLESNGHRFASDSGFPRTAYPGASFKVHLKDADATDYDWSVADAYGAVEVDANGVVSIKSKAAAGRDITITATRKQGGATASHRFRISEWFNPLNRKGPASYLPILCNGADSGDMPEMSKMSQGTNVRGVGTLWSEWGNALPYMMWAKNESNGPSYNSYMNGSNGQTGIFSATNQMDIVCSSHHN